VVLTQRRFRSAIRRAKTSSFEYFAHLPGLRPLRCRGHGRRSSKAGSQLASDQARVSRFLIHDRADFAAALLNQCVRTARFLAVLDAIYASHGPCMAAIPEALMKTRSIEGAWQKL
jgi:hypothetical protein